MNKHLKYLSYVVRHKWFVLVAGLKTGAPLWRLVIHDWSKLLPCEWFPYTNYFYGTPDEMAFNRAWLHHQHLNPHHWQHWVLQEDSGPCYALEMPEPLVREMVADWLGAGRAITGDGSVAATRAWFEQHEPDMILHIKTQNLVERLLDLPESLTQDTGDPRSYESHGTE